MSMANVDSYIKFAGVEGESTAKDHKGDIELLSWTWTASAAGGAAKPVAGDFQITHRYDKASPALAKACASGKHFADVLLTGRKAGDTQKDFLKVTFKDVTITSVQPSCSQEGDIVEIVTFGYREIGFGYKPQDANGVLGAESKFSWNVATADVS
jgi:type VI secretion system secreted protein Hcp